MLLNYNLSPWLVTKRFFPNVGSFKFWKIEKTLENIDVYMAPLIEELQSLWDGVDAVDVFDENKNHNFVIKVILM